MTSAPGRDAARAFFRYLPVSAEARRWGAFVTTAGFTWAPPGAAYPPFRHPADHQFAWEQGRVLPNHQLVYLERGGGSFESARGGRREVGAGDVMVLFPHEWHRYRPDPATGWQEYWLEFDGEYIRRLMALPPFDPRQPILHQGVDPLLIEHYRRAIDLLRAQPPGFAVLLGAQAVQVVAHLVAAAKGRQVERSDVAEKMRLAVEGLSHGGGRETKLEDLARQLGLSYPTFRRRFREHTGLSPRQFTLEVRLRRACDLLVNSRRPIGEIAEATGFESIFYFSRFFRARMGVSPRAFRDRGARSRWSPRSSTQGTDDVRTPPNLS